MATCRLCPSGDDKVEDVDILYHLRLFHPKVFEGDGALLWPDGRPVVVDMTLQPDDFGEATRTEQE